MMFASSETMFPITLATSLTYGVSKHMRWRGMACRLAWDSALAAAVRTQLARASCRDMQTQMTYLHHSALFLITS